VDFAQVRELPKGFGVTEGDEDDAVVGESGDRRERGRFLSSSVAGGGNENTSVFPVEPASGPECASSVPEGL
jgi:hypothetical protein